MCNCNRKHSRNIEKIRILARIDYNVTGERQVIYQTSQGFNYCKVKDLQGQTVIEYVPD